MSSAVASVHPWVKATGGPRFGAAMIGPAAEPSELVDWVLEAEDSGFDSWWKADHPSRSMETWTTLTTIARLTSRIRLGPLVSCVYYRPALVLARIAADVDHISGGRLVLGLGIGDDEREFGMMGLRFPPVPEREKMLEETIQAVRGLWDEPPFSMNGRYVALRSATASEPMQQPRVAVLIGGGGEKLTFRTAARHADAVNFGPHPWTGSAISLDDVRRKVQALHDRCLEEVRDFDSILRTYITLPLVLGETRQSATGKAGEHTQGMFIGTPDDLIDHYRLLVQAGMQYFISCIREHDRETLRLLATRVLPAFQS